MLETHIVMSSLILCLILILVLYLTSFIYLTIAHMVLVHEKIALCLDALVMAHVLIVVIVSRVCMVFLLEGLTLTLSQDTWTIHVFPIMVLVPLIQSVRYKRLWSVETSSGRLVKRWIPKIYLTNPSTESLTSSCTM
jgi:hypothetical protein